MEGSGTVFGFCLVCCTIRLLWDSCFVFLGLFKHASRVMERTAKLTEAGIPKPKKGGLREFFLVLRDLVLGSCPRSTTMTPQKSFCIPMYRVALNSFT